MSFNDAQTRQLEAKLRRRHVKTRMSEGETIPYLEGWHAISEANRIFGFGYWDRQTLSPHCHWANQQSGQTVCFYSTKVRISVRAGEAEIIREGLGTGVGRSPQPEIAHDMAIKSAETDATKRALATFGNAFGLALYDPKQSQVTKCRSADRPNTCEVVLSHPDGTKTELSNLQAFSDAFLQIIDQTKSLEELYAFWASNLASLKALDGRVNGKELAARIIESIKHRARAIVADSDPRGANARFEISTAQAPDSYLLPKEKRIRDRAHLAFVATQPCLICGRRPTQAHHLRFAQPRAMALKVSDEFTVPLCMTHHDQLHRAGDELAFWTSHGVPKPLQHAAKLWELSHQKVGTKTANWHPDTEQEFNEPALKSPNSKITNA